MDLCTDKSNPDVSNVALDPPRLVPSTCTCDGVSTGCFPGDRAPTAATRYSFVSLTTTPVARRRSCHGDSSVVSLLYHVCDQVNRRTTPPTTCPQEREGPGSPDSLHLWFMFLKFFFSCVRLLFFFYWGGRSPTRSLIRPKLPGPWIRPPVARITYLCHQAARM